MVRWALRLDLPHGFLTLHFATVDAGANAYLLTRDDRYLDLPRRQMDRILELGEQRDPRDEHMSGRANWQQQLEAIPPGEKTFLVPYRYGDAGWFDWMPMGALYPVYLWHLSMRDDDWERVERLRGLEANDWDEVYSFRDKHDAGHEQPWSRFLAGAHPHYPEQIQQASYAQVVRRMAQVHQDGDVGTRHHVHHWQWGQSRHFGSAGPADAGRRSPFITVVCCMRGCATLTWRRAARACRRTWRRWSKG